MTNSTPGTVDAHMALNEYGRQCRRRGAACGDDRELITDLITDLLKLVDTEPERFDEYDGGMVADTALENYYAEKED